MSSVIVALSDTEVIVGTDTLASPHEEGGHVQFFCSKAFMLPHMNMILAASGCSGFLEQWWLYLNTRKVFPGIESLAWSAQDELRSLWKRYKTENGLQEDRQQAVYQFGISEFTGEMLGFTYVSWDDFAPQEISHRVRGGSMIFAKPNCALPDADAMGVFPKAFVPMMLDQRDRQARKLYGPTSDGRVKIGGELQVHHLNQRGCAVYKLARFDDFDRVEKGLWGDFRASYAASHAPGALSTGSPVGDANELAAEVSAEQAAVVAEREAVSAAISAAAAAAGKSTEDWVRDVVLAAAAVGAHHTAGGEAADG